MVNLNSLGCFVFHIAFIASLSFSTSQSLGNGITNNALFIFGDSTVDSGNNNYIDTIPENKADYKPYGQNGVFHEPTGRFSDGRVITDFIAEYANNGVNFASGGAGVLTETNQGLVIDLPTQLRNFEEVRKSLGEKLGEEKSNELISEAVYFISIGSNDYMGGYLGNPKMQEKYNPEQYIGIVIGNLTQAIQNLYYKGARKFGFLSLSPLGCLPALRAANPDEANKGGCFEAASSLALAHNNALSNVLISLNQVFKGFMYSNSNFYDWLQDKINNPTNYGFKDGIINACCGNGPYGGIYTCGGTKEIKVYNICDNVEEFVWWDSFHPTEKIHEQFANALWNGSNSIVGPYNLEKLFNNDIKFMTIADVVDVSKIEHELY
ncbi:GDSL esterase/lipase [Trifolium repens]|nr:GDSL esterase/lipase [Trifolium repens]